MCYIETLFLKLPASLLTYPIPSCYIFNNSSYKFLYLSDLEPTCTLLLIYAEGYGDKGIGCYWILYLTNTVLIVQQHLKKHGASCN